MSQKVFLQSAKKMQFSRRLEGLAAGERFDRTLEHYSMAKQIEK